MNRASGVADRCLANVFDSCGATRTSRFTGLLVAMAAFLVYANSLGNGFVWDDLGFVVNNPVLEEPPISIFTGYPFYRIDAAPYYRPLTALTFLIEKRLHGLNPLFMHLFNVLLHGGNALLVYLLAQSLLKNTRAAVLAGLLFAVHPINTEGVNFLSARNDVMVGFFVICAFMFYRRSLLRDTFWAAIAGAGCFLAALLSKESAFGLIALVVAHEIMASRSEPVGSRFRSFGRLVPYMVVIIWYFIMRKNAIPGADARNEILSGLGTRLLDNLYIIPRYLWSVLWPEALSVRYYVPDDLHLLALPLVAAWICIIGVFSWFLNRGRTPVTLVGLLWIASFWLPVSGIIPIPSAPMADRYFYVPAIGLWIIAAERFSKLCSSEDKARRYCSIGAAVLIIVLSVFTVARNRDWKDDVTLFSRYVERYPERAFGHHNLGCAYLDQAGDIKSAEREFRKALALDPLFPRLQTQMGYIRLLRGDHSGAIVFYDEAIRQNPFDAEAYLNRAIALDSLGRYEDAAGDYRRFLAIPGSALARARPQAEARMRELTK